MGYASISGRARTSARNPQAYGVCDRCGFWYNLVDLKWQYQWAGNNLINLQLRVCDTCLDVPQEQLRAIVIPADPVPVYQPRPENFVTASTDTRITSGQNTTDPVTGIPIIQGDTRITQDDSTRVAQETGEPPGGLNQEPGTDPTVPTEDGGDDPGLPYGFDVIPNTGPLD